MFAKPTQMCENPSIGWGETTPEGTKMPGDQNFRIARFDYYLKKW
jgi:hypothetical protein